MSTAMKDGKISLTLLLIATLLHRWIVSTPDHLLRMLEWQRRYSVKSAT